MHRYSWGDSGVLLFRGALFDSVRSVFPSLPQQPINRHIPHGGVGSKTEGSLRGRGFFDLARSVSSTVALYLAWPLLK